MEPEGIIPITLEEETELRLVRGVDLSGAIQISNTEGLEFNGNENGRIFVEEIQAVEPEEEPFQVDLSGILSTESLQRPLRYVTTELTEQLTKPKTSTPIVTPTYDPNIFNVDWGMNKHLLTEFRNQKKSLFGSDNINTIEKHNIINISNKEIVNLLESTDNSLMLLREYLPQNIKRDIDNDINVPALLFGVEPKYISQFTLEYTLDIDQKPNDWEYVRRNVYRRNYGMGDTGQIALMHFRTVNSDMNESKSPRISKSLFGILGFVKFSSYLSSVRNPEEFAEAAAQMGMNEDDIFKKTRGFKELFILKLTEFDFRESQSIKYFSKRPDGVIELNIRDMWGSMLGNNRRHKPYQIKTVYL